MFSMALQAETVSKILNCGCHKINLDENLQDRVIWPLVIDVIYSNLNYKVLDYETAMNINMKD